MSKLYFTVTGEPTIREALALIEKKRANFGVLLSKTGTVRGVFTMGDLRRALSGGSAPTARASRAMITNPVTAPAGTPAADLDVLARSKGLGQSPVVLVDASGRFADVYKPAALLRSRFTREIKNVSVPPETPLRSVMRVIDQTGLGIALMVDKKSKLLGLVTDHDVRSAVIRGAGLEEPVSGIMNTSPIYGRIGMSEDEIMALNANCRSIKIPLLDSRGKVRDLVAFYKDDRSPAQVLNIREMKESGRGMKRILVTGGAGYLGSVLTGKLLDKGYRVRVLDKLYFGHKSLREYRKNPSFHLIKGDVRHIETMTRAMRDVDAVIHLAGIVGDPACEADPVKTLEQNYLSTVTLAQIARLHQVNRFIFASSCSVYGSSEKIATEKSDLNPLSLYAKDKIYSEQGLLDLANGTFNPTIMRMGTLFGISPRPRFDLVVNLLAAKAVTEASFSIYGGGQWRPFVHVSDAANAYVLALEAPMKKVGGKIFNLGSNTGNMKITELGRLVKKVVPKAEMVLAPGEDDKRNYRVSFRYINRALGFKTRVSMETGVREIVSAIKSGQIKNYRNKRYSNFRTLSALVNE